MNSRPINGCDLGLSANGATKRKSRLLYPRNPRNPRFSSSKFLRQTGLQSVTLQPHEIPPLPPIPFALRHPRACRDSRRLLSAIGFSDDFSGTEFGKRWGHYKSSSIIKDGVLVGITAEDSDHPAVDNVRIDPERDLEVSVKFKFVSDKAKGFNVWFDDKDYKGSHAGHICSVSLTPKSVTISDAKTGSFRNDIYEKKSAPEGLSAEDKEYLKTKSKNFPATLALQDWHTLVIRTKADEVEVIIDGKPAGSFKSEGVSHETKTADQPHHQSGGCELRRLQHQGGGEALTGPREKRRRRKIGPGKVFPSRACAL